MSASPHRPTKRVARLFATLFVVASCASSTVGRGSFELDDPAVGAALPSDWPFKRQRDLVDRLYFDACLAASGSKASGPDRAFEDALDDLERRASSAEAVVTDDSLKSRLRSNVAAVLDELRRRDGLAARR
jgi:hypothetical protein